MTEKKLKNLTLFLLETLILQNTTNITEWFIYAFNEFIYHCYDINKKLLEPIYNLEILDQFIKENYELLSLEQTFQLIQRYHGFEGYVNLVDATSKETDQKLNDLALMFIEYQKELYALYSDDNSSYYSKGYSKILQ